MTKAIAWARSNPITIASAAVAVMAIIFLLLVEWRGGNFVDAVQQRVGEIRRLEALLKTPVSVPPLEPDDPERQLDIAVNQAAIDELARVYGHLNKDYNRIRDLITEFNRAEHTLMLAGLFPEPSEDGIQFKAREAYRTTLTQMLNPPKPGSTDPGLDAQPGLSNEKMTEILHRSQELFLNTQIFPPKKYEELGDDERARLDRFKRRSLLDALRSHAQAIHLYAQRDRDLDSPDFPFDVAAWSKQGLKPSMDEIWRGQLSLWIQQDIVTAIARLNHTDDPAWNVTKAPIKKLVKISILPGFVGRKDLPPSLAGLAAPGSVAVGGAFGGPDPGRTTRQEEPTRPDELADRFDVSPSGRATNSAYDVVHATATVVIDSRHLGAFIDELQSVNLMTVLQVELEDVDEYEALRSGHVYGSQDVVLAKIVVETVWLREWTTPLMPASVRNALGVKVTDPAATPSAAKHPRRENAATGLTANPSAAFGKSQPLSLSRLTTR